MFCTLLYEKHCVFRMASGLVFDVYLLVESTEYVCLLNGIFGWALYEIKMAIVEVFFKEH